MTKPTIKEKIESILDEDNGTDYDINGIILKVARLICEEMTGKMIIPAETFGDQGYNIRVAENEVKAQEIFKALE